MGVRSSVSAAKMQIIVGIMNESAPKITRHSAALPRPISAV